ncbi:hypothetical protein WDW86_22095 [Bdellovibrionota bacterium FG-2]
MKMNTLLVLIASMAVSASAFAAEKTGSVSQALGEPCGVSAFYTAQDNGCSSSIGTISIGVSATLFAFKSYDISVQVINSADYTTTAYTDGVDIGSYDIGYSRQDLVWTPSSTGLHQVNLFIFNHITGNVVCSDSTMVTVN